MKNWPQRNHILKQRLLFEGKVRAKEGEYDGASMIVPTNTTLDQWIDQSKAYGSTLNHKERQSGAEKTPNLRFGGTAGVDLDNDPYAKAMEIDQRLKTHSNLGQVTQSTYRSDEAGSPLRSNRIQFNSHQLRVERQAAPFLPLNPNVRQKQEEAYVSHVMRDSREPNKNDKDKGRSSISMAADQTDANRKQRTSPKFPTYSQILKDQADRTIEEERRKKEMLQAEKLRPATMIRSQQPHRFIKTVGAGDQCMRQELDQQRNVIEMHRGMWDSNRQDPSGESMLKQPRKTMRGANSQPAITTPKTQDEHKFGNRDRSRTIKKIENGTEQLYSVYHDENRRLFDAKEGLRKIGQRTAWGRKTDNSDEKWKLTAKPFYKYDLREQLIVEPASNQRLDLIEAQKQQNEKQQKWKGLVEVQDEWEKLRVRADEQLVNISTKLNPLYDMQDYRANNKFAQTKDYVTEGANAKPRVKLVKKKGMEQRVENYKEELRAYEYMVSRGLVKEAKTKEDLQNAVRQFKQITS